MSSSALRVLDLLTRSRFAGLLLSRFPGPVAQTLRDLREDVPDEGSAPESEVRRGDAQAGASVRGVAFSIGDVCKGSSIRAVNVVKGAIQGGSVRAVNLVLGDVLGGELRAVNVIVGDVRGGDLRDVHLIVGDVYGGCFERCYAVLGNVHGGSGRLSRVVGQVHAEGIEVEARIDP